MFELIERMAEHGCPMADKFVKRPTRNTKVRRSLYGKDIKWTGVRIKERTTNTAESNWRSPDSFSLRLQVIKA
jgi:hypothetical protein